MISELDYFFKLFMKHDTRVICRSKTFCKLGEFAGWEGGQIVARPRSTREASQLCIHTIQDLSGWES